MDKIKYNKDIGLVDPIMIAGWPGMGSVALGVVDYIQRKLNAVKFAEIEVDPLAIIDSVVVEDGLTAFGQTPKNTFYYTKNPDLIIFKGEAQLPGHEGILLLEEVLELALKFKVKRIYTGAAFPVPASYKDHPQVYSAFNQKTLKEPLARLGLIPMESGHISGLNGLLLGFAGKKGIGAACLLATMPQYAISLPNPKASLAIIEVLQRILGFRLDIEEMGEYIRDMDEKMSLIEERVKDVMVMDTKEHGPNSEQTKKIVPPYIMKKIEKLFREATSNKSKAISLKSELDRWDLYKIYEDRFLDLFKENQ
ncbi:MAG: PAC2 family protein [Candidatus Omnitrophota bacterium]|nr:PAC2 family protein [Candidatus Omnitrophota bacterium]